jgi:hypothetical protein
MSSMPGMSSVTGMHAMVLPAHVPLVLLMR